MSLEYIKHDRVVSNSDIDRYGKLASYDIEVPILLLYEAGKINDKNGQEIDINRDFIIFTHNATNEFLEDKYKSIWARMKSAWNKKDIKEIYGIPLIKDHNVQNVDGKVGYLKGLVSLEEEMGVLALKGVALIIDLESKVKVINGLLTATSIGTRKDGSIREVSFVINEALPHGGLQMSEIENNNIILNVKNSKNKTSSQSLFINPQKPNVIINELKELELQEEELENKIIPNHIILSKLIKNGKIMPWKYDQLVNSSNREALELMEENLPSLELGIMYGTNKTPEKIDPTDSIVNDILTKYNKNTNANISENPNSTINLEAIKQSHSFEEDRKKELKHILELAEYSPEIAKKYISVELGEKIEIDVNNEKYLYDYLLQLKSIKNKIKDKRIELGEVQNA